MIEDGNLETFVLTIQLLACGFYSRTSCEQPPKKRVLVVAQSRQQVFKSKQIMNSRQLWNLYQRNKFLRTEASRDILKFRVLEMAFPGVFFFHHGRQDVFRQNIHKTGNMQCYQNISGIPQHHMVRTCYTSKPV